MTELKEYLVKFNPWWNEKIETSFKSREVYQEIQKFMPLPQIIAFTGLRRVGKTTIMMKIIDDYIKKGFDPKRIVYFSFDAFKNIDLFEVLKNYEDILGKRFEKEKLLILFDEVQKTKDWENQLKTIYDLSKNNAKIIISGSESLFIRKESKETLAGRIFEFSVGQLTFKEFLNFKNIVFEPLLLYEREIKNALQEFILIQGFPELINMTDKTVIEKYLTDSIVDRIIYKDIPSLVPISDPYTLQSLFNIIREEPGQIIDFSKLASELNISRRTVSLYLTYLEKSFLIKKLYNYSKNKRKVEVKSKKYYPSVISPNLLFKEDDFSKSKLLEWLMMKETNAEFFWRDVLKHEVDLVLFNKNNKEVIPIEIKYGKIDLDGMKAFVRKFNTTKNYIISSNVSREEIFDGKKIQIIPAHVFLLEFLDKLGN